MRFSLCCRFFVGSYIGGHMQSTGDKKSAQETERNVKRTHRKERRHNKSAAFFNPADLLYSVFSGGLGGYL